MAKGGGKVKETKDQKVEAEIALKQERRYIDKFMPLERDLIRDVQNSRDERGIALSDATGETTRAFGDAKRAVETGLTNVGAGPGSAKFALAVHGTGLDEGTALGGNMVGASNTVDTQRLRGLESLAAMGRGQQAEAVQGLGEIADLSRRQAISDATLSAQNRAAWMSAAGSLAGAGAAAYGEKGFVDFLQPMQPMTNRPVTIDGEFKELPTVPGLG